jgi:hypothetical protein
VRKWAPLIVALIALAAVILALVMTSCTTVVVVERCATDRTVETGPAAGDPKAARVKSHKACR